ncbi:hypothetical protein RRG08_019221 [Elysia crispata]|uniref:Uncharacterized protein n=1 Tax=Elysia crispata TaxID=231223 RepID=A0AAE1E5I6_9GAST|nr:hypothetical protein RRG08_019221 [Elysia crispata]
MSVMWGRFSGVTSWYIRACRKEPSSHREPFQIMRVTSSLEVSGGGHGSDPAFLLCCVHRVWVSGNISGELFML